MKKERYLEYLLDKQITWIKFADTKSSIILSVTGVLLAIFIRSNFFDVNYMLHCKQYVFFGLAVLGLLLVLYGSYCLFKALIPRLKNKINDEYKSHIFFGSIAKGTFSDFYKYFLKDLSPNNDLIHQNYIDSQIALKKMKYCNRGVKFICGGYAILILVLFVFSVCSVLFDL